MSSEPIKISGYPFAGIILRKGNSFLVLKSAKHERIFSGNGENIDKLIARQLCQYSELGIIYKNLATFQIISFKIFQNNRSIVESMRDYSLQLFTVQVTVYRKINVNHKKEFGYARLGSQA